MYLMIKDEPVLKFDITKGNYILLRPDLLPFKLRDRIIDNHDIDDPQKKYMVATKNHMELMNYFSTRVLNLDRENAKKILNAYHFSQSQDAETKTRIAIACRCVSMTDDYWISDDAKTFQWKDINPRQNKLNKIVSHVALLGTDLTATGLPHTPELTGRGAYAKAWMREADGNTYLYKAGSQKAAINESKIEIMVSNILDKTNVPHVRYSEGTFKDKFVCKCKNMCSDKLSIVPAEDVYAWCNRTGRNFEKFVEEIDKENYYKTMVVDYLISNSDRHGQNWGFYMDNISGKPVGLHPLYDHNNAFEKNALTKSEGCPSLMMDGKSQRDAAKYALRHCDFKITGEITLNMFPNFECYKSFMDKACELEIYRKKEYSLVQKLVKGTPYDYILNPEFKGQEINWEEREKQQEKQLQKEYKKEIKAEKFKEPVPIKKKEEPIFEETFDEYLERINRELAQKMNLADKLENALDKDIEKAMEKENESIER